MFFNYVLLAMWFRMASMYAVIQLFTELYRNSKIMLKSAMPLSICNFYVAKYTFLAVFLSRQTLHRSKNVSNRQE